MDDMMDKRPGGRRFTLIAGVGMALCCGLPLLLVSGGLGAMMAWLLEGGLVWLALALILAAAVARLLWRRRPQQRAAPRSADPRR
ncbi:MAG: hypothetical protein V3R75_03010 [Alphaproteobacteria bacterium]